MRRLEGIESVSTIQLNARPDMSSPLIFGKSNYPLQDNSVSWNTTFNVAASERQLWDGVGSAVGLADIYLRVETRAGGNGLITASTREPGHH